MNDAAILPDELAAAFWVAHASRVLVAVSHRNKPSVKATEDELRGGRGKFAKARTPSPARETRALPGFPFPA